MPEAKAGFLSQLGALYRDHPLAAWATTAAVGGTIIYLALKLVAALSGGDEPPIRVKGGSEHFIISHDAWERQQTNNDKIWKPLNRDRSKDGLDVVVLYKQGATCQGQYATADDITIVYEGGGSTNSVFLKSTGNHLKVTSDKDLTRSPDRKTLSYGTDNEGYTSNLVINGNSTNPFCSFTSRDQLEEILILDW
jgi:hypothetical protein